MHKKEAEVYKVNKTVNKGCAGSSAQTLSRQQCAQNCSECPEALQNGLIKALFKAQSRVPMSSGFIGQQGAILQLVTNFRQKNFGGILEGNKKGLHAF